MRNPQSDCKQKPQTHIMYPRRQTIQLSTMWASNTSIRCPGDNRIVIFTGQWTSSIKSYSLFFTPCMRMSLSTSNYVIQYFATILLHLKL